MARLRDLKVGMEVQIIKGRGNPDLFTTANIGLSGTVVIIDDNDSLRSVFVKFSKRPSEWYPTSWIKIVKDEGENEMTQKTKVKQVVTPQNYILIDDDDHTRVFTDVSARGICKVSNDEWGWNTHETISRLSSGKMKLFKIEEVKLEITEPSIKIIG